MNPLIAPSLRRRLASMLYEAVLLFGVLAITGLVFALVFQQRHALYLREPLAACLFLVIGLYFTWFWSHGGQTLAMKTWRIRVVCHDGAPLGWRRAAARYLLAWMWFLPGLVAAWAMGAKGRAALAVVAVNMAAWALTIYLDPKRQFLHDRLAGTGLIDSSPKTAAKAG